MRRKWWHPWRTEEKFAMRIGGQKPRRQPLTIVLCPNPQERPRIFTPSLHHNSGPNSSMSGGVDPGIVQHSRFAPLQPDAILFLQRNAEHVIYLLDAPWL